jgi:tagatose-1,6-bisphosphate aldolase non-catalytic subunit AgaZ/GatZ
MTAHVSNFGGFGSQIPADDRGFVTYSPRKVARIVRALRAGEAPPAWADVGANRAVAEAEAEIDAWRRQ